MNVKLAAALAMALLPLHTTADSNIQAALTGCAAIKNVVQKTKCYDAVAAISAKQETAKPAPASEPPQKTPEELEKELIAVFQKKFEPANRAATAIKAATDVGVSYNQYSQYIQQLATELAIVSKDATSQNEQSAVRAFQSVIEAYKDAGAFWEACIRFYSHRDNNLAYGWGLPLGLTNMEWFASKYGIQTHKADMLGFHQGVTQSEGLSAAWRNAATFIENANAALNKSSSTQNLVIREIDISKKYESIEALSDALILVTNSKIGLDQYNRLVQELENEIAKVRTSVAGKRETSAIYNFDQAIQAYKDAGIFWQACNDFPSDSGGVPACATKLGWFVEKYKAPSTKPDIDGDTITVPQASGLRKAWDYAYTYIANAKMDLRKPGD